MAGSGWGTLLARQKLAMPIQRLILLLALTGCVQDGDPVAELPDAGSESELPSLRIDSVRSTTNWDSIPIQGVGPSNGTLHIRTSQGEQQLTLGSDGSFCLDLALELDTLNTITFQASNLEGLYSEEVSVDVLHIPRADNQQPNDELVNVALRATDFSMSNVIPDSGAFGSAVDGEEDSYVVLKHTSALGSDWFGFKLTERAGIDHIQIIGTPDCYPEDYSIYLSDFETPGVPWDTAFTDWERIETVWGGAQEQVIVPALGDPKARFFAIRFNGNSCGPFFGYSLHEVREIKIMSRDAVGDPEPPPPEEPQETCETLVR